MEKSNLLPASELQAPTRARRHQGLKYAALSVLTGLALLHTFSPVHGTRHDCSHKDGIHYKGEHITWHGCGEINGRDVECSKIEVPMDQFDSVRSGNKTFTIPLIRMRGKDATENILLNPGGPGGSGINFLYRKGEQLRTLLGEGYHLLSFDPRGVNASTPTAHCYPNEEVEREHPSDWDIEVIHGSPKVYAWTQGFVQACRDTMDEHGEYINTPQTAADMNSILDAVGQKDMYYWGFSYGTILGQTYATLFPERSKRVIIDGVANVFDWYTNPLDPESLVDTENVLDGFFDECIKAGKNCTLATHGETKEELYGKVMNLTQSLVAQPLSVYVNNTLYGTLDRTNILYEGIFTAMYKPGAWWGLADRLAKMLDGNATDALIAYGGGNLWGMEDNSNEFVTFNDGPAGPGSLPSSREALLDLIIPAMNHSLFGPTVNDEFYQRQQWKIPKRHDFVPRSGVETAHPLLILTTTYDPVCPLLSAMSARSAFVGSQIVEVKGYGHCSVAVPSTCLAKHVRAFFNNGTVPQDHTYCEVDGPYFIAPEEEKRSDGMTATARKHFEDPEDRLLHLAQVELAMDPHWPRWD